MAQEKFDQTEIIERRMDRNEARREEGRAARRFSVAPQ